MKTIKIGLSTKEINRAIKDLAAYKQDVLKKTDLLQECVSERLAEEAGEGFSGAIVDDIIQGPKKAQVNVIIDRRGEITVVIAKGKDAVWVEFGSGVYHNSSLGSSPHPKGAELGFTIGDYGKGMGKKRTWGFDENGELMLTHGTPAKMPMYNAVKTVCEEISEIAREIF